MSYRINVTVILRSSLMSSRSNAVSSSQVFCARLKCHTAGMRYPVVGLSALASMSYRRNAVSSSCAFSTCFNPIPRSNAESICVIKRKKKTCLYINRLFYIFVQEFHCKYFGDEFEDKQLRSDRVC